MYIAYKYKLKPNSCQAQILTNWVGCSRYIWNWCLEQNIDEYKNNKKFIFGMALKLQLPELKKKLPWLAEIPSQALQNRVLDFDAAIRRTFKGKTKSGFPKFKSKHNESHNTLRIDQTGGHIKPTKNAIKIPKLGWVKWNKHRPLTGKLKSITIKQENDNWYAVCLCDIGEIEQTKQITDINVVGIDLGLTDFAITSNGEIFDTPRLYRKKQKKLKYLQRKLSKKSKGSKNRNKAKKKVRNLHVKIKNQRADFTHKISSQITKDYDFIGLESLNIKGMSKNKKLSKSILDQGWAMFVEQLKYKSKMKGGLVVQIDRFAPSTKTCSNCGTKHELTLSDRRMICDVPGCGLDINRDLNAAINIKNWAFDLKKNTSGTEGIQACGDTSNEDLAYDKSSYVSVKQEKFLTTGQEADMLLSYQ